MARASAMSMTRVWCAARSLASSFSDDANRARTASPVGPRGRDRDPRAHALRHARNRHAMLGGLQRALQAAAVGEQHLHRVARRPAGGPEADAEATAAA